MFRGAARHRGAYPRHVPAGRQVDLQRLQGLALRKNVLGDKARGAANRVSEYLAQNQGECVMLSSEPVTDHFITAKLDTVEAVRDYVFGGNSTVTLRSVESGKHYTYKVQAKKDRTVFFVSNMYGYDEGPRFQYIGVLSDDCRHFHHSPKSKMGDIAKCFTVFRWFIENLARGVLHKDLEVWHEGRCGRCGRVLTVAESIARGIGPKCVKYKEELL
jgi:hypothetical protein